MSQSAELHELFTALSLAQGDGMAALKSTTGQVGQQKTRYADLAACWDACRAPLAKHGLSVVQVTGAEGSKVTVRTILGHKSGQWIDAELSMVSQSGTPQALGSAITYARRYALCSMVGIAPEDDDGAAASQGSHREQRKVADRKMSEAKAAEAVPDARGPDETTAFKRMLDSFGALKAEFGKIDKEPVYYTILAAQGFEHANEIRELKRARDVYRELAEALMEIRHEELGITDEDMIHAGERK